MLTVMGGLVFLLVVAIYSALNIGKKTDQRITGYVREDAAEEPITVRFPSDVFRVKQLPKRGQAQARRQT